MNLLLSRKSLAQALEVSESTVDEFVRRGVVPEPRIDANGEPTWDSAEVERRIQTLPNYGTVYVAGFGPYVKIGFTLGTVQQRIAALQTGAPEKLVVYATLPDLSIKDEAALHRRFSEYRLQGEWFRREGLLGKWIADGCRYDCPPHHG